MPKLPLRKNYDFFVAFDLKKDIPGFCVSILSAVMRGGLDGKEKARLARATYPKDPFFDVPEWDQMFVRSYDLETSFPGAFGSKMEYDAGLDCYRVLGRAATANAREEAQKFMAWVTPYIDAREGDFLGYLYFEGNEAPALIYYPNKFCTGEVTDRHDEE